MSRRGHGASSGVRDVIEWARTHGWTISDTHGGHLKFTKPGCRPVFGARTPSCPRAPKNLKAMLERFDRDPAARK